jgi:hypothetical protein
VVDASPAINTTLYHNLNFFFSATSRQLLALLASRFSWWSIQRFQRRQFPTSLLTPKPSNGNGGLLHLAGELFKMMTGVDLVHVPYRGAQPALTDLISGQVQVMFVASTVEYIKTGKVRALAVTTLVRSEVLPDVPPLGEFVPGYDRYRRTQEDAPLRSSTN